MNDPKVTFSSDDLQIGDKVTLCGDHPWKGSVGVIMKFSRFAGKPSMIVKLQRDDAMDGHDVGVTSKDQFQKLEEKVKPKSKRARLAEIDDWENLPTEPEPKKRKKGTK